MDDDGLKFTRKTAVDHMVDAIIVLSIIGASLAIYFWARP